MMLIFLTVVFICVILLKPKKKNPLNELPGPSWLELFKLLFFSRSTEDVYRYLIHLPNVYGTVVNLWLKPFRPVLLVADPKFFESILTSKDHLHKTSLYDVIGTVVGNGLVTNKDLTSWKSDRKMLGVLFSRQAISQYSLNFKKHTDKLIAHLKLHENESIDVQSEIAGCTLDIILENLSLEPSDENTNIKLIKELHVILNISVERTNSTYKRFDSIFCMTKNYKKWNESVGTYHKLVDDMLQKHLRLKKKRAEPDSASRKRFLDLLLESDLSYESILFHLKTFIIGGFDTTAAAISFALFELAKRPDIQQQLYEEYTSIFGHNDTETLTFEGIQSMTFMEQVVKETLRMYPPVPLIQRKILTPITIADGLTIPSGVDVIFSIPSLHNLHFKNPTKFEPERFCLGNINKARSYEYAPFSVGPRDCIGRKIAMVEIKFILSAIINDFTLHAVQPMHTLNVVGDVTLKSNNGVPVIFKKRNRS